MRFTVPGTTGSGPATQKVAEGGGQFGKVKGIAGPKQFTREHTGAHEQDFFPGLSHDCSQYGGWNGQDSGTSEHARKHAGKQGGGGRMGCGQVDGALKGRRGYKVKKGVNDIIYTDPAQVPGAPSDGTAEAGAEDREHMAKGAAPRR